MKYIVLDNDLNVIPIIFPDFVKHDMIHMYLGGKVISAGFIHFIQGRLECYGESISLKVKARPEEDTELVNKMIGADNG